MRRVRWRKRVRYAFDRTMSRGTPALVGWLALVSAVLVVVVASLALLIAPKDAGENGDWPGVLWRSLLRTLDPGTMGGDQGGAPYLGLMLTATVGGILIVSSLIGVLTAGLNGQIQRLRKGHSVIVERDHVVLLGWSEQVFTVVSSLVKANEGHRRPCVAILADHDKVDMEEAIRDRLGNTGRTRVVCRRGDPLKPAHLGLVSPDTARSIIVITPEKPEPDTHVIKVLLSLGARVWEGARPPVVAAVHQSANLPAARLAGGPDTEVVDAEDLAIRLVVQSHRQSGLSTVSSELLDFAGNEFYMRAEPALTGRTYGEILDAYELGIPVGLWRPGETIRLNPPMDTVLRDDHELVIIAEDDLLIRLASAPVRASEEAISTWEPNGPRPARTLLIGWNARVPKVIELLDSFAQPRSELTVAAARPRPASLPGPQANLAIGYAECDPTCRGDLERLDVGSYEHVIVLSDDDHDPDHADARTLATLLHLRDMAGPLGDPYSIVSEINDDGNREIAQVTRADDFIVSARLISLLLTQLAENRHLKEVFTDLLDPLGSEIYLKPASHYLRVGVETVFATVIEAARRRGETAIGYRLRAQFHQPPGYGVVLNPRKDSRLKLAPEDRVIVLAEGLGQ